MAKGKPVNAVPKLVALLEPLEADARRRAIHVALTITGDDTAPRVAELAKDRHIPAGRFGKPNEPAAAIVFLASPLAGFITGATLEVTGGQGRHV